MAEEKKMKVNEEKAVDKAQTKSGKDTPASSAKIAVVSIRGTNKTSHAIVNTLKMLHLNAKNHCVVLDNNAINMGMLKKVKDFVTWGELDESTYKELVDKRGEEYLGQVSDRKKKINYNRFVNINGKKYKPAFRLNPPRKGFGRKGIKMPFKLGGALGYRGQKINDLIKRML